MTLARAHRITSWIFGSAILVPFAALLALSGCATPTQQASLTAGAVTLGAVAAAHNTTVASLVTKGALFCQQVTVDAPLVVALANLSGVPVSVTGQASDVVANACAGISAIPVPAPVDVVAVPVIMAPSALALPAVVAPKA